MEFKSMAWFLEVYLAAQRHKKAGHEEHLRAHAPG